MHDGYSSISGISIKKAESLDEKRRAILECEEAFAVVGGIDHGKIIDKVCANAEVLIAYTPEIVGYCAIYANSLETREGYITLIGVKKAFQGQQIGSGLLDAAIDVALQNGMNAIKLEVYKENEKAKAFYLKHGFVLTGEKTERGFYMRKAVV